MPRQRLSQARLQRCLTTLQALIAAVHDARQRYPACSRLKAGRLGGLSRYLKGLLSLPANGDYSPYEVQLKRRLVRVQHRLYGLPAKTGTDDCFALATQLPPFYDDELQRFDIASRALLRVLADVDIKANHQQQLSVAQTRKLLS